MLEGSVLDEASELEKDTRSTSIAESTLSPKPKSFTACKTKTSYAFAHPPPTRHNFLARPKVLLQLQRVSKTARPTPILEVLPSITFASKIGKRLPRHIRGKVGLGPDDFAIVNSEKYDTDEADNREPDDLLEDTRWDEREVVSIVSNLNRDKAEARPKAEIWLNKGQTWTASILPSGSYEFSVTDGDGLRTAARWVRKQQNGGMNSTSQTRSRSISEGQRFSFSLLNPDSRRHAIIATLDRHYIEVSDRYSHPPPTPRLDSTTPPTTLSEASADSQAYFPDSREALDSPIEVDDSLRTLIIVSGIWVAFQEGFSAIYNNSDASSAHSSVANSDSKSHRRSISLTSTPTKGTQCPSPERPKFGRANRASTALDYSAIHTSASFCQSAPATQTTPQRSGSTGAAFMNLVHARNNAAFSANKTGQLSPVGDLDDSDVEKASNYASTRGHGSGDIQLGNRPSLSRPTSRQTASRDPSPGSTISNGLSEMSLKKPRKLGKVFSLRRRTSGVPHS
ncbi:hypothetical protein MMC21_002702 [Puttea exsequens]|nr:hypothetical protein [Puttea exsequens]